MIPIKIRMLVTFIDILKLRIKNKKTDIKVIVNCAYRKMLRIIKKNLINFLITVKMTFFLVTCLGLIQLAID